MAYALHSSVLLFVCSLTVAACHDSDALPVPGDGGSDAASPGDLARGPRTPRDKIDVLFMVDDSNGEPYKQALRVRLPSLVKALDVLAAEGHSASYHFGVVTSDLGAPGINCGKNRGAKLQALGAGSAAGCAGPVGSNFLAYDQTKGTNNVPAGQDLSTTLGCMMNVGDRGCGFEMQLEAVYRALHDPIPENQGFLRSDALLVVVIITDEDDCSVDPTSDLFTANPAYGSLASFRCTRFGVFCDGALVSATAPMSYQSCTAATPAQGGKLTDLAKYINFFAQPASKGGVKSDPRDVVVSLIAAPPSPFSVGVGIGSDVCGTGASSCAILDHSCASSTDSSFFGDPGVRLDAVVQQIADHATQSMCDADYTTIVTTIGDRIRAGVLGQ